MSKQRQASIGQPVLKKLVVDFRYKPTLRAYASMDLVGLALSSDFPDWERAPLALEIRNRQKHRRLQIRFRQSVFDCINPGDEEKEFDIAKKSVKSVTDKVDIAKFERFALRFWFVAEFKGEYESLVRLVHRKFCTPVEDLAPFPEYALKDAAYAVDLTRDEWAYGVRVGPMTKDEWFSSVHHERKAFEAAPDGETFEKYAETLPDRFVYLDIDVWREHVLRDDARRSIRRLRTRAREIADGILEHLQR